MTLYLPNYSHFPDKYEMDDAANRHLSVNWNELNGTDRAVLDMIRRYSVKHGAAHLKAETIATGIQKSVATVRRAIRKLEALRIIERVPFIRRVLSGRGANIYAILPLNDHAEMNTRSKAVEPTESKPKEPKTENEPLFLKSSLNQDLNKTLQLKLAPSFDNLSLFSKFKALINATIGDKSITRKLYGTYMERTHIYRTNPLLNDIRGTLEKQAIQALKITLQAMKMKRIDNLPAYYRGVLGNLIMPEIMANIEAIHEAQAPGYMYVNEEGERIWL